MKSHNYSQSDSKMEIKVITILIYHFHKHFLQVFEYHSILGEERGGGNSVKGIKV